MAERRNYTVPLTRGRTALVQMPVTIDAEDQQLFEAWLRLLWRHLGVAEDEAAVREEGGRARG